ncbi:hypothetical protein [Brevibacillus sp. SIMBA_076]|uniref:hypothetical protein n=1 Tax=Brevibacillus sp. SIMBA_076 TaxID=3085814 RepID=UPI00397BBF30
MRGKWRKGEGLWGANRGEMEKGNTSLRPTLQSLPETATFGRSVPFCNGTVQ